MNIYEARKLIIANSLDSQVAYFLGAEIKINPEQRKGLYEARNTLDRYNFMTGHSNKEIDTNLSYMTEHGE